jgi:cell filamentation protein
VELEKGGFCWPPAFRVAPNMDEFEKRLLAVYTPCNGPLPRVAQEMAEVHAELLLIHPFREGNGRLARWLADLMALQAGLPAPLYGLGGQGSQKRQRQYLDAVRQGYAKRYEPLTRFFLEAFDRRLRHRGP